VFSHKGATIYAPRRNGFRMFVRLFPSSGARLRKTTIGMSVFALNSLYKKHLLKADNLEI
jgi:hypothetical protein